jgi:transcriptional regulator with XRE-family HTH domain
MTGSQVKAQRKTIGMTQAQLAKALGVSRVTVTRWETDAVCIPERSVKAIEAIIQAQAEPTSPSVTWEDMQRVQLLNERHERDGAQLQAELKQLTHELDEARAQLREAKDSQRLLQRTLDLTQSELSDVRFELMSTQLRWQRTLNELAALKLNSPSRSASTQLLHQILSIDKSATAREIKSAYRAWAHVHHPDKNPNRDTNTLFAAVTSAYEAALASAR